MIAPMTPGDALAILAQLDTQRRHARQTDELPPQFRADVVACIASVRGFMKTDPHVGPLLEGALARVVLAFNAGALRVIQAHDLRTLSNFLRAVPTTWRGAA